MSQTMRLSILPLALAGVAACSDARATGADADLQRDLQLASSTMNLAVPAVDSSLLSGLETTPKADQAPATTLRRASGSRAIQSRTPTVRATPDADVAAVDESLETEVMDVAAAPEVIDEPVAIAPRPEPIVIPAGGGDYGTGSNGGIFGRGGVVIRGGGVDGDNCELHDRRRRGNRGPVFYPSVPVATNPAPRSGTGGWGNRTPGVTTGSRGSSGVDRSRGSWGTRSPGVSVSSRNPGRTASVPSRSSSSTSRRPPR